MAQEPRPLPSDENLPDQDRTDQALPVEGASEETVKVGAEINESVKAAVQRMWDVVKQGADIIVTLRQENTLLQSQMSSLRKSEEQLQDQVQDFLERISTLEDQGKEIVTGDGPTTNIDRLEDRIQELETSLGEAKVQLEATTGELHTVEDELAKKEELLEEQTEITQQLVHLRSELASRTQLFQELQAEYADRHVPIDTDEERDRVQAELDRSLEIIQKYRDAGLRHIEDADTENQVALFEAAAADTSLMTNEELIELADRLESVAKRLDELFGLS